MQTSSYNSPTTKKHTKPKQKSSSLPLQERQYDFQEKEAVEQESSDDYSDDSSVEMDHDHPFELSEGNRVSYRRRMAAPRSMLAMARARAAVNDKTDG